MAKTLTRHYGCAANMLLSVRRRTDNGKYALLGIRRAAEPAQGVLSVDKAVEHVLELWRDTLARLSA
ncbi:MAG: hypothetical protein V3V08_16960 [Nannocystaceae bacterium]